VLLCQPPAKGDRRGVKLEWSIKLAEDDIIVPHPEFGRLRHEIATATERFRQATRETHGSLALIGCLQTITLEDRKELIEQIEAEHEAYEAIRDLHDKIVGLLREKPQARAATTNFGDRKIVSGPIQQCASYRCAET